MSEEIEEVKGIRAIARVLGISIETFRLWLAEAAPTDDPLPVYRRSPSERSHFYGYADELRAWKKRRPYWRPSGVAATTLVDRPTGTVVAYRQPKGE